MFKLTIEDDEGKTTVIPLIRDEMTIGRQDGNTIRLTERNISRKHARLLRQNGTMYIEDLASYTGVRVNASAVAAEEGKEALELVVVTLVVASRTPLSNFKAVESPQDLEALLTELGSLSPDGLLGLEVVWTPADANDSMTETDVMTTYPELRGI